MSNWRWFSVFAVLILVLAACGDPGTSAAPGESDDPPASGSDASEPPASDGGTGGEPQTGGTLVFGGAALAASLDPALTSSGSCSRSMSPWSTSFPAPWMSSKVCLPSRGPANPRTPSTSLP
jgi:hypothetical protein